MPVVGQPGGRDGSMSRQEKNAFGRTVGVLRASPSTRLAGICLLDIAQFPGHVTAVLAQGVNRVGYVLGTGSGLAFLMAARDFEPLGVPAAVVGAGGSAAAVLLVLAGWVTAWRTGVGRRREARRRPLGDDV